MLKFVCYFTVFCELRSRLGAGLGKKHSYLADNLTNLDKAIYYSRNSAFMKF